MNRGSDRIATYLTTHRPTMEYIRFTSFDYVNQAWIRYVHSSFAIILMGKRELVALLSLSSWCLVMVVWLFLAVPWVCLRFVVFPDHTHYFWLREGMCLVNQEALLTIQHTFLKWREFQNVSACISNIVMLLHFKKAFFCSCLLHNDIILFHLSCTLTKALKCFVYATVCFTKRSPRDSWSLHIGFFFVTYQCIFMLDW